MTPSFAPAADALTLLPHDQARFGHVGIPAAAGFNQDQESSGVIEVTALFESIDGYETGQSRYFLLDVQAHYWSRRGNC